MNLLMICILAGYFAFRVGTIYATNEYDYLKKDLYYTEEQMNAMDITLGKFNDSFNIAFGFQIWDPDFDSLNNPYF